MKSFVPVVVASFAIGCGGNLRAPVQYTAANEVVGHGVVADHDHDDHDDDHETVPTVSPEAAARVIVLQSTDAGRPVEVIGTVDVHVGQEDESTALNELRARGAAVGADAVLGVEFHHGESGPTHLSGMAVRFRSLLENRPYDIVGHLHVREAMGHEHGAMDELRAQARDLRADLIVNIAFEHGENATGLTDLSGDAIRYR